MCTQILGVGQFNRKIKDCPPPLPHTPSTPPVRQHHQLIIAPQATLRPTGGVPGKVGLHLTTYVCFVFFSLFFFNVFLRFFILYKDL